jgi:FlaA1/EpsC-like NDP-sugar epimerase
VSNILLTGAGSLGEAFIELLRGNQLTVIESHEETVARLSDKYPEVRFILDDFSEWKFDQDPVEVLIHTAAYKHLPLGEENPNSFIDTNIIKTRKLFAEAFKNNVDILFISTDKAVEPCNLYGYTKAIGEKLCTFYNGSIARCGNFLGSSGSVIPVWEQCIKDNKPIKITDPEMKRFVIELDDAAKQIWDDFTQGKKLIIPTMQEITLEGIKLLVLNKHGLSPDYPTEIIGKREGEKMSEKLRWEEYK